MNWMKMSLIEAFSHNLNLLFHTVKRCLYQKIEKGNPYNLSAETF